MFLTKYSRNGASSRYRTYQYLPLLKEAGVNFQVIPLFTEAYLEKSYQTGTRNFVDILNAFLQRIAGLVKVRNFELVAIEYELFPYLPALPERLLGWFGIPYIVDYDDALFHQYDQHTSWYVRFLLRNKIARVMKGAHLVTVGNNYLADYAQRAGAKHVEIIPTVVDLSRYPMQKFDVKKKQENFIIGWIGSPSTTGYLEQVLQALKEFCKEGGTNLRLIGAGFVNMPNIPLESIKWEEDTEIEWLKSFDVGIMPLSDTPWTRGKCGLKLIQYMACGLPVVASPVGVNKEIVEHGINGFLAETDEEWVQAISTLKDNPELRKRMGEAGRHKVEEKYSLQVTAPRLIKLIRSLQGNN